MKTVMSAALAILMFSASAEAKPSQILRGLFCNTRAQVEEALGHMRKSNSMAIAVALTNRSEVACVFAYRIRYMVIHPIVIGRTLVNGQPLTQYKATLVGVLVGENPRPIVPPLTTYFVPMDPVRGADSENGA